MKQTNHDIYEKGNLFEELRQNWAIIVAIVAMIAGWVTLSNRVDANVPSGFFALL